MAGSIWMKFNKVYYEMIHLTQKKKEKDVKQQDSLKNTLKI